MNNFVQYVSYGCCGRNSGSDLSYSSGAGDDSNTNDETTTMNLMMMRKEICFG
jgi:hypothetical protein